MKKSDGVPWHKGADVPSLVWRRDVPSKPEEEQIAEFVYDTEFGFNYFRCREWDGMPAEGEVIFIGVYGEGSQILRALNNGLSVNQQWQRRKFYLNDIGERK